jgi:hypothetical protein
MLLFRDVEHIDRWRSQWNQPPGAALTIDQVWQLADAWFRNKMDPDWRRATLEETQSVFTKLGLTGPFWSLQP